MAIKPSATSTDQAQVTENQVCRPYRQWRAARMHCPAVFTEVEVPVVAAVPDPHAEPPAHRRFDDLLHARHLWRRGVQRALLLLLLLLLLPVPGYALGTRLSLTGAVCTRREPQPIEFNGTSIMALRPKSADASELTTWLEMGAFDAIKRKYLDRLVLVIFEGDPNGPEASVLEEHSFTVSYPEGDGEHTLELVSRDRSRGTKTKQKDVPGSKSAVKKESAFTLHAHTCNATAASVSTARALLTILLLATYAGRRSSSEH